MPIIRVTGPEWQCIDRDRSSLVVQHSANIEFVNLDHSSSLTLWFDPLPF